MCIISTMQSAQYKVKVYEYPNFNNDVTGFNVYMDKFTWGYHELQNNIQSYKMDVPVIWDQVHVAETIIYSPIITLIDNENNYYHFNDLEIEQLPNKKYKIIIIQISHIPIRYKLQRDTDGNLTGTEVVEYYDNNGHELHVDDDYYDDVYQIKMQEINVLVIMCDRSDTFETKDK